MKTAEEIRAELKRKRHLLEAGADKPASIEYDHDTNEWVATLHGEQGNPVVSCANKADLERFLDQLEPS